MIQETQKTINEWQEDQFEISLCRPMVLLRRVAGEGLELMSALIKYENLVAYFGRASERESVVEAREHVGEEMADVVIYLVGLAGVCGVDLRYEVQKKMEKNRTREWTSNGDGTFQHVEKKQ